MTSLSWAIYFIGVLGGLHAVLSWGILMIIVSIVVSFMIYIFNSDGLYKDSESNAKMGKRGLVISFRTLIGFVILLIVVPNTDTMHQILGIEITNSVIQTEAVQEIGQDLIEIGRESISRYKQELVE